MFGFLLSTLQQSAGAEPALEAAQNLFGPVGLIIGVVVVAALTAMGIAIRALWKKNNELHQRNKELQRQNRDLQKETLHTMQNVLEMMQRVENQFYEFTDRYDRGQKHIKQSIRDAKNELISSVREQN